LDPIVIKHHFPACILAVEAEDNAPYTIGPTEGNIEQGLAIGNLAPSLSPNLTPTRSLYRVVPLRTLPALERCTTVYIVVHLKSATRNSPPARPRLLLRRALRNQVLSRTSFLFPNDSCHRNAVQLIMDRCGCHTLGEFKF